MLLFLVLGYTKTIKKGVTNLGKRKENAYVTNCNSISIYSLVSRLKYKIEAKYIEYQKITIENVLDAGCLCRVDINHRLFKIVYLEPQSIVELLYDEPIDDISISNLLEWTLE